jgi:hypothetical protein
LSDGFPIQKGLKWEALPPLPFNFALKYVISKVHESQMDQKLNGTHQLVAYADEVTLLADNRGTIRKHWNLNWC